ncbi:MAG: hypothetical protein J6X53_05555 [Abditibacteriota bacterium]|nr:hypothetical protein [Abditibacteriota bacterium]
MKENVKVKELIEATGALAEMSLFFYRATLQSGASEGEAFSLTAAFINAMSHDYGRQGKSNDE